jgi:acyl-coenzyme A thioesterase PaaI-like protein
LTSEVATRAGTYEVAPHACFACGTLNAHGLHLVLHVTGDTCWTELELLPDFQGWEGIAHGGIVATILDEVMAWALAAADAWGYTARMAIEYRRPAPIGRPIRGEGRIVRQRRRLVETAGRLLDPATGEVFATAEGLYVAAPEAERAALKERYGFRLVEDAAAEDAAGPGADR